MKFRMMKLTFTGNVHFGEGLLSSSAGCFCADTLFSALCTELADVPEQLCQFVNLTRAHRILLSDSFPFVNQTLFLPKPCIAVRNQTEADDGNSVRKKMFKKLHYIPVSDYTAYLHGEMTTEQCTQIVRQLSSIGKSYLTERVSIDSEKNKTTPYSVGAYRFRDGSGLWCIFGTEDTEAETLLLSAFQSLQYTGIGGKRSSGYGRFSFETAELPVSLSEAVQNAGQSERKISLSVCLPCEKEMESALKNAAYLVMRRSGFVASPSYSENARKKNDFFALQAGSCFVNSFMGDVYDVSAAGGAHSVWRYAIPMFLGVGG
ncbi:MAG: type III-A CRISPR-associated RAMP protein Csm4 [Oscillospiraceae bacterium]|nr:type III-A CRISPR-associated RAMP protein Csm4 [Oscillospiraceae bacterium]MBR1530393.1 type III-A CRISPR-associated RAMP protein Csm4 [Oscillospiraceae bacterium]